MQITEVLNTVVEKIGTPEIKDATLEAAKAGTPQAILTYVALSRFGTAAAEQPFVPPRVKDPSDNDEDTSLASLLSRSSVRYFGPMFKEGDTHTPIRSREKILIELEKKNYCVEPLSHLTDEQLDMLFTKMMETGIVADFNSRRPVE
jgi:hypothetical protein